MRLQTEIITRLNELNRPFRADDVKMYGLNSSHLAYYCTTGKLERLSRGIYILAKNDGCNASPLHQLIAKKSRFTLCLFSALQVHQLTTQSPISLWIAIGHKSRLPNIGSWNLECIRLTNKSWTYGVEEHLIDGLTVPVYSAAKTVADCFKFRHKIGIDVAIEALKDGYYQQKFTMDELLMAARINRVTNVITPYIETLIS